MNCNPASVPLTPPSLHNPICPPRQRGSSGTTDVSPVPPEHRHLVNLASLLPQRVIENLVAQRRLGKQGNPRFATKYMEAALLFIDISGFTASMEMFAQQGSEGIEKFWKMFNAYFCDLLDVIQVPSCRPRVPVGSRKSNAELRV